MLPDLNLKKNISTPETLPSTPGFNSSQAFNQLTFDQNAEQEKLVSSIMGWFDKNGIKAGNPDDIVGRCCQQKREQILGERDVEITGESKLLERRKCLKKDLTISVKGSQRLQ